MRPLPNWCLNEKDTSPHDFHWWNESVVWRHANDSVNVDGERGLVQNKREFGEIVRILILRDTTPQPWRDSCEANRDDGSKRLQRWKTKQQTTKNTQQHRARSRLSSRIVDCTWGVTQEKSRQQKASSSIDLNSIYKSSEKDRKGNRGKQMHVSHSYHGSPCGSR